MRCSIFCSHGVKKKEDKGKEKREPVIKRKKQESEKENKDPSRRSDRKRALSASLSLSCRVILCGVCYVSAWRRRKNENDPSLLLRLLAHGFPFLLITYRNSDIKETTTGSRLFCQLNLGFADTPDTQEEKKKKVLLLQWKHPPMAVPPPPLPSAKGVVVAKP